MQNEYYITQIFVFSSLVPVSKLHDEIGTFMKFLSQMSTLMAIEFQQVQKKHSKTEISERNEFLMVNLETQNTGVYTLFCQFN